MVYLIRESVTQFVDGWYRKRDDAERALLIWGERRPEYEHWLEAEPGTLSEVRHLKDAEMLNRNHDYNA